MSFARFAPLLRTRVAAPTTGYQAIRSISATASYNKGAVDATKDTLKKADRTVSDAAVKGINKGGMSISSPSIYQYIVLTCHLQ